MYEEITAQARQAVLELLEVANLKSGDIFVVGCSSSEMVGQRIGKGSSLEAAQAAFEGIYPVLQERGTLIGMHLKEVAVPVRLSIKQIGEANILCARTRPPYVGGERARYREDMK